MKRGFWFVAAAGVAVMAGCGNKDNGSSTSGTGTPSSGSAPAGGGKQVGITLLAQTDPFYNSMRGAMETEAKAKNMTLDIQDGRKDLNTQLSQVETFVSQKKDAIVVCPADSTGIGSAIGKANAAKIPVFTADIKADKGEVVSHIASDNVAGGKLAGDYLAKLLNGKGKVVVLDFPNVASVRQRTQGFVEAVSKYPGIKIVERPSAKGERNEALNQMENMLQKYPDLDGVFAINDNTGLGALKAIQDHKNTHIVMVGYDGDKEAQDAIAKGTALKADAVQYPDQIGKQTIDAIDDYFHGKKPAAFVPVKVGIIDQKSLQSGAK